MAMYRRGDGKFEILDDGAIQILSEAEAEAIAQSQGTTANALASLDRVAAFSLTPLHRHLPARAPHRRRGPDAMQRARDGLLAVLRGSLRLRPDTKAPLIRCYLEHVLSQLGAHSPRIGLAFTRLIDPTGTWIAGIDLGGGLVVLRHAPYDHGADAALFDHRVVIPLEMMDCAAATIGPAGFPPARSAALKQLDGAMAGIVFIRGSTLRHDCLTGVLIPETTVLDMCKRKTTHDWGDPAP